MATNFVVDGDQALKLGNRLAELQRQLFLQKKCKLDPELVVRILQGIIEGKMTPSAGVFSHGFIRIMPIVIGGVPKGELIEQTKGACHLDGSAEGVMYRKEFTTLANQETCILVDLSPSELGFTEEPRKNELFEQGRLLEWSKANLDDGWAIDLCPAEVGPHLAIQYKYPPKSRVLWIGMERIPDLDGFYSTFCLTSNRDRYLWLKSDWRHSSGSWDLDDRVVLRLRRVSSASAA